MDDRPEHRNVEAMTLTDFLLARIAEDESWCKRLHVTTDPGAPDDVTRVLAECEAKRLLIERVGNPDWAGFNILALPYAAHPDYRPEFAP